MNRTSADTSSVASFEESWRPGGDSNPRSVPAPDDGDLDNRSLLIEQEPGSDPAIHSPRECDCPPQVVRCVHVGDLPALVLTDPTKEMAHENGCWLSNPQMNWCIGRITAVVPCPCCRKSLQIAGAPAGAFDSEADALAAFYEAERELLGREPFLHEHPLYGAAVRHALGIDEVRG